MTFQLFPQLPRAAAEPLAAKYASLGVEELRAAAASRHESQTFSPTGGQKVSEQELVRLASNVRDLCAAGLKPVDADRRLAPLVRETLAITRHEAALDGVWAFLGCVLLPDIVRWRFAGPATPNERFLGGSMGVRNAIGRLWWRAELLRDEQPPPGEDEYWMLRELNDDEVSGIVDRPRAFASRRVAAGVARALLSTDCRGLPRMEVARDALKVFLRRGYFVEFEALKDHELTVMCEALHRQSVTGLLARRERCD